MTVNNAAMNIGVQRSESLLSILLNICPEADEFSTLNMISPRDFRDTAWGRVPPPTSCLSLRAPSRICLGSVHALTLRYCFYQPHQVLQSLCILYTHAGDLKPNSEGVSVSGTGLGSRAGDGVICT